MHPCKRIDATAVVVRSSSSRVHYMVRPGWLASAASVAGDDISTPMAAMAAGRRRCLLLVLTVFFLPAMAGRTTTHGGGEAPPVVPAIMVFGDSFVDAGNNDYIDTLGKVDFPPYGRDFKGHVATGRFSNGKMLSDHIGENLGFSSYPLPYLSPEASGKNLLIGANFASGGSGYDDNTAHMYNVLSLSQQLDYFREYRSKLAAVVGDVDAQSIISGALYITSFGNNDFALNYYINPLLQATQTLDHFSDFLVANFDNSITQLYDMGARRIGVMSIPPLGCTPISNTVFGHGSGGGGCVPWLNDDSRRFNRKISTAIDSLSMRYHDLGIAALDIYTPLYSLCTSPESRGFTEVKLGCCGTGTVELGIFCNPASVGTCPDAAKYVYWDAVHPSEAATRVISDSLLATVSRLVA